MYMYIYMCVICLKILPADHNLSLNGPKLGVIPHVQTDTSESFRTVS